MKRNTIEWSRYIEIRPELYKFLLTMYAEKAVNGLRYKIDNGPIDSHGAARDTRFRALKISKIPEEIKKDFMEMVAPTADDEVVEFLYPKVNYVICSREVKEIIKREKERALKEDYQIVHEGQVLEEIQRNLSKRRGFMLKMPQNYWYPFIHSKDNPNHICVNMESEHAFNEFVYMIERLYVFARFNIGCRDRKALMAMMKGKIYFPYEWTAGSVLGGIVAAQRSMISSREANTNHNICHHVCYNEEQEAKIFHENPGNVVQQWIGGLQDRIEIKPKVGELKLDF